MNGMSRSFSDALSHKKRLRTKQGKSVIVMSAQKIFGSVQSQVAHSLSKIVLAQKNVIVLYSDFLVWSLIAVIFHISF
jgi:hypothetical protein